jgi:hypothetical protein
MPKVIARASQLDSGRAGSARGGSLGGGAAGGSATVSSFVSTVSSCSSDTGSSLSGFEGSVPKLDASKSQWSVGFDLLMLFW